MAPFNLLWVFFFTILLQVMPTVRSNEKRDSYDSHQLLLRCPIECYCTDHHDYTYTTLHCKSLRFINKLFPKEINSITSLDLSNSSMHSLDKKLKKLVNLERLNLSQNKLTDINNFPHLPKLIDLNLHSNLIKSFSAKHLPKSLLHLDVSHNLLRQLPRDLILLQFLHQIDVQNNPFSCNAESLDIRDALMDRDVIFSGKVVCHDPPNFRGQPWIQAVDLDEFFKLHDRDMLADEGYDGSGDMDDTDKILSEDKAEDEGESSGDHMPIIEEIIPLVQMPKLQEVPKPSTLEIPTTTDSDSDFNFNEVGSGDDIEMPTQRVPERIAEASTLGPVVNPTSENTEEKANIGTNIFLGVFLLCLVALLIYAVKKNKEKKRENRRKRRNEKLKAIEMMPKNYPRKPSDKQNGNTDTVPFLNGQNGNSKTPDDDSTLREAEEGLVSSSEPTTNASAPLCPPPEVQSVKVRASEIPDSVPQTPILVTRNRSSDGKSIVVTPKATQKS